MTRAIGLFAGVWLALAGARVARAQDGREAITPLSVDASSTLKDKKHAYDPWHAIDGVSTTAWCEGAKSDGAGEALTISGDSVDFSRLEIAAGFWKSDKLFRANNQPTALRVTVTSHEGTDTSFDVSVPSGMSIATLEPGGTVDAMSIRIEVVGVTKGKMNDTCLSEVTLYDGDRARIPYLDSAASIDDLMTAIFNLDDALQSCDSAALATNTKFPMTVAGKKVKKLKDLVKACKAGSIAPPGDPDFHGLSSEGPGKVVYGPGQGRWHLGYEYNPDGYGGVWKVTAVDY